MGEGDLGLLPSMKMPWPSDSGTLKGAAGELRYRHLLVGRRVDHRSAINAVLIPDFFQPIRRALRMCDAPISTQSQVASGLHLQVENPDPQLLDALL
jgi:hypothetical protein